LRSRILIRGSFPALEKSIERDVFSRNPKKIPPNLPLPKGGMPGRHGANIRRTSDVPFALLHEANPRLFVALVIKVA
jgi:hypothetical protein